MRIPHKRGFSRNRLKIVTQVVNLADLEKTFSAGDVVSLEALHQRGLIDDVASPRPVKVLGEGSLTKALRLEVHAVSASARAAVEQAGGTVALVPGKPQAEKTKRKKPDREPAAESAPAPSDGQSSPPGGDER
jgi:large subunit ribosomal protein L15